jgi:predicted nucleic acid-binding protein
VEDDALRAPDAERGRGARSFASRALTLVIDASVGVTACLAADGFSVLPDRDLVAPALLWSETRSALHELVRRGEIAASDGEAARDALERCPVRRVDDERLGGDAWHVADELGLAKTYDAEYIALARLLACWVVTLDARLRRGADRLGLVVSVSELR